MLRFTHFFDGAFSVFLAVIAASFTAWVFDLAGTGYGAVVDALLRVGVPRGVFEVLPYVLFVAVTLSVQVALLRTILPAEISTYLYVRFELNTPISMTDASMMHHLFSPGPWRKWYPMREVKTLPKVERRAALLEFARRAPDVLE